MRWIEIEVDDRLFEVCVTGFELPRRSGGYEDPGDPGEIDLGPEVRELDAEHTRLPSGRCVVVTTEKGVLPYSDFLRIYAEANEEDALQQAERDLLDECYDIMIGLYEDSFPDP